MNRLHRDIDKIDEKLFKLLKSRLSKAKRIARVKMYYKDPIENDTREQEIISKLSDPEYSMYKDEITAIYKSIFEQMKKLQQEELDKE
jgi:chorismate mutase